MQCLVESDSDQRGGPDSVRGVDQETPDDTSHTVSDKVGTKCNKDLVCETSSIGLIVYISA